MSAKSLDNENHLKEPKLLVKEGTNATRIDHIGVEHQKMFGVKKYKVKSDVLQYLKGVHVKEKLALLYPEKFKLESQQLKTREVHLARRKVFPEKMVDDMNLQMKIFTDKKSGKAIGLSSTHCKHGTCGMREKQLSEHRQHNGADKRMNEDTQGENSTQEQMEFSGALDDSHLNMRTSQIKDEPQPDVLDIIDKSKRDLRGNVLDIIEKANEMLKGMGVINFVAVKGSGQVAKVQDNELSMIPQEKEDDYHSSSDDDMDVEETIRFTPDTLLPGRSNSSDHGKDMETASAEPNEASSSYPCTVSVGVPDLRKRPYKCLRCKVKPFLTQVELAVHLKCHVTEGPNLLIFQCPHKDCKVEKKVYPQLMAHLVKQHEEYKTILKNTETLNNALEKCSIVTKRKAKFEKCRVQVEKCEVGSKEVLSTGDSERCEEEYQCVKCDFVAGSRKLINQHTKVHQSVGYKCCACDKMFALKSGLKAHAVTHKIDRPKFKCAICGGLFGQKDALKKHHRRFHEKVDKIKCQFCNYESKMMADLKKHELLVHKKLYSCPACDFKTNNIKMWNEHKLFHEPENVFSCPYYDCYFKAKTELLVSEHLNDVHKIGSKYQCPVCSKFFPKKPHLTRHLLTHTGEKLFKCAECHVAYRSHSSYYRHRQKTGHDRGREGMLSVPQNVVIQYDESANMWLKPETSHGTSTDLDVDKQAFLYEKDGTLAASDTPPSLDDHTTQSNLKPILQILNLNESAKEALRNKFVAEENSGKVSIDLDALYNTTGGVDSVQDRLVHAGSGREYVSILPSPGAALQGTSHATNTVPENMSSESTLMKLLTTEPSKSARRISHELSKRPALNSHNVSRDVVSTSDTSEKSGVSVRPHQLINTNEHRNIDYEILQQGISLKDSNVNTKNTEDISVTDRPAVTASTSPHTDLAWHSSPQVTAVPESFSITVDEGVDTDVQDKELYSVVRNASGDYELTAQNGVTYVLRCDSGQGHIDFSEAASAVSEFISKHSVEPQDSS